ncbi:MAG TPA: DUF5808 domain-containing protein [Thermomicrobiaceae bacterium]|nr:DUF5808 domain-containing protein [Thermomicrobiaceae bacterium]
MNRIRRLVSLAGMLLAAAAIIEQLRLPADERTWEGRIFSIPYDFRVPTLQRMAERWWNPNDVRLFVPQVFGVGWTVNLYQARRLVMDLAG